MTKDELKKVVLDAGDAIITFRSLHSKKLKYNVCTLDFENNYISTKSNKSKETEDTLLMFCWDTDTFRLIRPENVTSVVPISKILKAYNE